MDKQMLQDAIDSVQEEKVTKKKLVLEHLQTHPIIGRQSSVLLPSF